MCGIIAGFNTTPKGKGKKTKVEKINNFIVDQYQDQCNRGQKGFGIIRIDEKGKIEVDRATEEIKFLLDLYLKPAKMIIAHHRQPTSSDNKISQTHPIFITHPSFAHDYYFIHNGVISNDVKLKKKHNDMGYNYITEYSKEPYYPSQPVTVKYNDTEALGVEVVMFIEGKQSFVETTNTAAFIALQVNKKTGKAEQVYFGRSGNTSMLNLDKYKGNITISSEGKGEEVIPETLWSFCPTDPKMKLTSKGMEFKEIKEETPITANKWDHNRAPHQHMLPKAVETKDVAIEGTKLTDKVPTTTENAELVIIQEREWAKKKDPLEESDYEEIFVDKKSYQEDILKEFKEWIKPDESDVVETSLESSLDDQVERIGKIMGHFQKIIQNRKVDPKERSFYLSQTYTVLKTMEALADLAEEEYNLKITEEELKAEEEAAANADDPYDVSRNSIGYRTKEARKMGIGIHDHDYQNDYGDELGFNRFG